MNFIIFVIDTNAQEYLFIFEYKIGSNRMVLGELIKLNNFCYIKDFEFDFFEIVEDPNYALNKEGIYIYKYNHFSDVLHRLDIKLTPEEIKELKIQNKEMFDIMTKKTKEEIFAIINEGGDNHELFRKLFEPRKKK